MMVVFISNYLNHHQIPFCNGMDGLVKVFRFIATTPVPKARQELGYADANRAYDYVVRAYEGETERQRAMQLCRDCDVLIIGSAPEEYVVSRLKLGKLSFKYSERFYKEKPTLRRLPHDMISAWLHMGQYQKYPFYMLSASAYTALDAARFGNFKNRCYKWGYFPEVKRYDARVLMEGKKNVVPSLLWAGRFLDWKHPDDAILVAEQLKKNGYSFSLDMIGTGPMEQQLQRMITEKGLSDCVYLLGSMPPEEVRNHMERANIYLFTSDRGEGWGAVLNESMNSGCAVVASHAIGSVPFLMKDNENGLIYRSGDVDMLYEKVKHLLDHPEEQRRLGMAAYETMADTWNAETAAERLLVLIDCIQNGKETPYQEGPCSRAPVLREGWYRA